MVNARDIFMMPIVMQLFLHIFNFRKFPLLQGEISVIFDCQFFVAFLRWSRSLSFSGPFAKFLYSNFVSSYIVLKCTFVVSVSIVFK